MSSAGTSRLALPFLFTVPLGVVETLWCPFTLLSWRRECWSGNNRFLLRPLQYNLTFYRKGTPISETATSSTLKFVQICICRSQWPRGLRRRCAAERLLGSWVRIPPGHGCLSCTVLVLSGRGLCYGPISRPEESYRLWCVFECDQVKIKTFYTYCEQVGNYETKRNKSVWKLDLIY
jgi:hypothetical protein